VKHKVQIEQSTDPPRSLWVWTPLRQYFTGAQWCRLSSSLESSQLSAEERITVIAFLSSRFPVAGNIELVGSGQALTGILSRVLAVSPASSQPSIILIFASISCSLKIQVRRLQTQGPGDPMSMRKSRMPSDLASILAASQCPHPPPPYPVKAHFTGY